MLAFVSTACHVNGKVIGECAAYHNKINSFTYHKPFYTYPNSELSHDVVGEENSQLKNDYGYYKMY